MIRSFLLWDPQKSKMAARGPKMANGACNATPPATPHHLLNPKWPTELGSSFQFKDFSFWFWVISSITNLKKLKIVCEIKIFIKNCYSKYQISSIRYQVFDIKYHLSNIKYEASDIKYQISSVKYQVLDIKYQISSVRLFRKVLNFCKKILKLARFNTW